ncbi:amidase family protein [Methylobacterium sp. OT2]|uniref:amidase n=1 Tax=Methylobacterium sp. OT2 TaxID=2813779 RepID=UPI00197B74CA|nr:amidase family protein [Methylobacterium sp. OT2]MBN4096019.1 amidase [Methylobacterium sp. OT2]
MKTSEYAAHDAVGIADLVRRGEVTAAEVRQAALKAVAAVNPTLNAVVEVWADEPMTAPEGSGTRAPLAGVPLLLKDLAITAKGRRNELGSRLGAGMTAAEDTELMRRFRAAGLTPIGRTSTPEMAISTTTEPLATGATRNPWDVTRSAGGSSGGAGAAVASGCVPVAHATDGGGSIRVPAACTGVFGLKPTRGRVSNGPGVDEVWSGLAVQFALSRSVRDSAVLLDAVHGASIGEPYEIAAPERPYLEEVGRDPGPIRIALVRHPLNGRGSNPAMVAAVDEVAGLCERLGHHVEEVLPDIGVSWEGFVHANAQFWATNTAAWLDAVAGLVGRTPDRDILEPATFAVAEYGRRASALELLGALDVRNTVTRRMGTLLSRFDVLLSPTLAELPLPIGAYNRPQTEVDGLGWIAHVFDRSPFTAVANVAGLPAMSVPLSVDPESGLPIGSQFVAGFGREDLLFRLAGQLERAAPWAGRRPPIWAGAGMDS